MKRIRIWALLAVFVATAGCRIEEAEYFEPTDSGFYMFWYANRCLSDEAAVAARVMLFSAYYSAPEEEREMLHDRYFYASRIVRSGDRWRIIDTGGELVIDTGGESLSMAGATWRYACSSRNYSGDDLPTITCRPGGASYDLHLPGGGELSFAATYCSRPQDGGSAWYGCELQFNGAGECPALREHDCGLGKIAYGIVEPLMYLSNRTEGFERGVLRLTAQTADGPLEARAEYEAGHGVWIFYGNYKKRYVY